MLDMALRLFVACFFVGSAIFFAEVARENKWVSGERARKVIHILIGIWGAWLPMWLTWRSIVALGLLLLIGSYISSKLLLFKSIHSVTRQTVGEYLFPVSMVLLALFVRNEIIFAAAMLQLGIADGLAAVVGTRYGKRTQFKVLGFKKSWHGTITFFVCSMAILVWAIYALQPTLAFATPVATVVTVLISSGFATVLTLAELSGIRGIDNVTVPALTAAGLWMIR